MADRLTPEQEAALLAAEAKATPGPWTDWSHEGTTPNGSHRFSICRVTPDGDHLDCLGEAWGSTEEQGAWNARLVIAARNSMPSLLAELAALRGEKTAAVDWAAKLEAALGGICSETGQPIGEIVLGRLREKRDG